MGKEETEVVVLGACVVQVLQVKKLSTIFGSVPETMETKEVVLVFLNSDTDAGFIYPLGGRRIAYAQSLE